MYLYIPEDTSIFLEWKLENFESKFEIKFIYSFHIHI